VIQVLAVFGTLCLIASAIPEAIKVLLLGHSTTPKSISLPVVAGLVSFYFFLLLQNGFEWVTFIAYIGQIVCWGIIAAGSFYKKQTERP
jgi:hypothetical protein